MFQFWGRFGYVNKSKLLLNDTYNLACVVEGRVVYEDFTYTKKMSDLSEYSKNSKFYKNSTKILINKRKDDTNCVPVL